MLQNNKKVKTMNPFELPDPKSYKNIVPQMLSARELRETIKTLFEWLNKAEQLPAEQISDYDELIEEIRNTVNTMLAESRLRHSDSPTSRG